MLRKLRTEVLNALAIPGLIQVSHVPPSPDCQGWLYRNSTFCDWLQLHPHASEKELLWLKGSVGSGKTTAISHCYHQLLIDQTKTGDTHYIAAFYFDKNGPQLQQTFIGMLRTLLYQLLRCRPDFVQRIAARYDLRTFLREDPPLSSWTEPQWQALFSKVIEEDQSRPTSSPRTTIFINAVNECSAANAVTELDQFFRKLARRSRNFKVCLSTTHLGSLGICQGPAIEVETANREAIRSYVDEKLEIRTREDRLELQPISRKIEAKSCGIFLWVHLVVALLLQKLSQGVRNASYLKTQLALLPNTLKNLYGTILREGADNSTQQKMTFRFFQWAIFAPDLSLRGWRDLLPFLETPTPVSRKASRKSEYWAAANNDLWMEHLDYLICRVSLGLARTAPSSKLTFSGDTAECLSVAGNAGSLDFNNGDMRVVQLIHQSVRQLFLDGDGFAMLHPKLQQGQENDCLVSLMHSCLDFVFVPELDKFIASKLTGNETAARSRRRESIGSSHRSASAKSSVRSFTSASSLRYGKAKPGVHSAYSSTCSTDSGSDQSSCSGSSQGQQPSRIGSLLEFLPATSPYVCVDDWIQELDSEYRTRDLQTSDGDSDGHQRLGTTSSESASMTSNYSIRSFQASDEACFDRKMIEYPEFLQYALSVFPQLAQKAERRRIDAGTVIERLRDPNLLRRYFCLSEESAINNTLQQWAESHELLTWVLHLSRTRSNLYMDPRRSRNNDTVTGLYLSYCFDHGDQFLEEFEVRCPSHTNSTLTTPHETHDLNNSSHVPYATKSK